MSMDPSIQTGGTAGTAYNPYAANTQYAMQNGQAYQQNQYQQDQAAQQAAYQKQLQDQQNAANMAGQTSAQQAAAQQQANQIAAANQQQQADLAYKASVDAQKNKQFNDVYGMLNAQAAALNGQYGATTGAALGQQPRITSGPMWTAQEQQQNLNANRAQTDQSTQTQVNNMRGSMAGHGYGARSPLAAALENQTRNAGMGQKADYTRQFSQQARQANVQNYTDTQQAQEKQYSNRQNEANQRYNTQAQSSSSLYNALANLI